MAKCVAQSPVYSADLSSIPNTDINIVAWLTNQHYGPLSLGPSRGLGGVAVRVLTPTSEAASSNLMLGASCWKVGSYLPMPGGLQCSMHWFPPPVNYPSNMTLAVERDVKQQINLNLKIIGSFPSGRLNHLFINHH